MQGKTRSWKGRTRMQPERCPHCGKRGLGAIKAYGPMVGQRCRYCGRVQPTEANPQQ